MGFFTTWDQEANWKPTITIDGKQIPFKRFPKMLGVWLDRKLSFNEQTAQVTKQASSKLKLLAVLANAEWGWRRDDLMKIFEGFIQGKLGYAAAAWQPWLSNTSIKELDVVQNQALRLITGQFKSNY